VLQPVLQLVLQPVLQPVPAGVQEEGVVREGRAVEHPVLLVSMVQVAAVEVAMGASLLVAQGVVEG